MVLLSITVHQDSLKGQRMLFFFYRKILNAVFPDFLIFFLVIWNYAQARENKPSVPCFQANLGKISNLRVDLRGSEALVG